MGVDADQAGDDGLSGAIDLLGIGGNVDFLGGSNQDDGVAFDKEGAFFDFARRDRLDRGVCVGLDLWSRIGFRRILSRRKEQQSGERGQGGKEELAGSHGVRVKAESRELSLSGI